MTVIATASGQLLDLENPKIEQIRPEDIACSLANMPRFNGHLSQFYTVAQHCCHVHDIVAETHPDYALTALLHEITEYAGLGDIADPFKQLVVNQAELDKIEKKLCNVLGLICPFPLVIKWVDKRMCDTEAWAFHKCLSKENLKKYFPDPFEFQLTTWPRERAYTEFMQRHYESS